MMTLTLTQMKEQAQKLLKWFIDFAFHHFESAYFISVVLLYRILRVSFKQYCLVYLPRCRNVPVYSTL